MAPLVNKILNHIILSVITPELASLESKLASLSERVEKLEKDNPECKQKISDIGLALKGIYELINSLISICSKR